MAWCSQSLRHLVWAGGVGRGLARRRKAARYAFGNTRRNQYPRETMVWLSLTFFYVTQGPKRVLADLRDPVLAPFVSVSAITGMFLASALSPFIFETRRIPVGVFLGHNPCGRMADRPVDPRRHRRSLLPSGLLPSDRGWGLRGVLFGPVHLHAVGEASFGVGIICWVLLGSILLNRLFFRPGLPCRLYRRSPSNSPRRRWRVSLCSP